MRLLVIVLLLLVGCSKPSIIELKAKRQELEMAAAQLFAEQFKVIGDQPDEVARLKAEYQATLKKIDELNKQIRELANES